jgi:hypothetical protein
VKFQTMDPTKLPRRTSFGKASKYSTADVQDAIGQLNKGIAVSDGQKHKTRALAHNAAGVLRARIKKAAPDRRTASTVIENADQTFTWWIAPDNSPAPATDATQLTITPNDLAEIVAEAVELVEAAHPDSDETAGA